MKIAIDIGGTTIRVGLIQNNVIESVQTFETKPNDFNQSIQEIYEVITSWKIEEDISFVGICSPGPLDIQTGLILNSPNLPDWNGKNIKVTLAKKLNLDINKISINNDANIAALGQWVVRGNKNNESLLYFTISTGIGSGFIYKGAIFNGYKSMACEIANAIPDLNNSKEDTDRVGIEYFASGNNIVKQLSLRGVNVSSAKQAFELLDQNSNPIVNDFFKEIENKLVQLFATAIYFFNPELIVVGGSVAENNKKFFENIFKRTLRVTYDINYQTKFEFSKDLTNATLLGCVSQ